MFMVLCLCLWLVVKPVTGAITVEAAKLSCLFPSLGCCPISVTSKRVSERKVYVHPDPCTRVLSVGCRGCFRAVPTGQYFQQGWACLHMHRTKSQMQNIYFCDFAQKLRLHLFLSKGIGAHLMVTQEQVQICPDYYAFQVVWLAHPKTRCWDFQSKLNLEPVKTSESSAEYRWTQIL